MGFYGNITNVSRTQFQFDKIYPNRVEMERAKLTDSIYLGRHVLIEYDSNYHRDSYLRVWFDEEGDPTIAYTSDKYESNTSLKNSDAEENPIVVVYGEKEDKFYAWQKPEEYDSEKDGSKIAEYDEIVGSNDLLYTINYTIDLNVYKAARGYDSTVWQKVYSEGSERYVMIAELNTVVPTFEVSADAPTMSPITPHFDTRSTDVYYKLHWQAPWGFRIAAAEKGNTTNNESDLMTSWERESYDPNTGATTKEYYFSDEQRWRTLNSGESIPKLNAAIYFNQAGFNEYSPSYIDGINLDTNQIKITPSGKSGQNYNKHDGSIDVEPKIDTQEMIINLPAIGNMMSNAWDIIHGDDRKDSTGDEHPSLQGRLNAFGAMQDNTIAIKRSKDGTLVGTQINGNTNRIVDNILNETLDIDNFAKDDAWIKVNINTVGLDNDTDLQGISIHHTFHPVAKNTKSDSNKNTDQVASNLDSDKIDLYTPIVDAAGHVVGKNTETVTLPYGYKTFTTSGLNHNADSDIYTTIVENEDGTHTSTSTATITTTVADNTQDSMAIEMANKWLQAQIENDKLVLSHEIHAIPTTRKTDSNLNLETDATIENNINIPDWSYDKAGHITGKHDHYYTLPFGFKTMKVENSTSTGDAESAISAAGQSADSTQDTLTFAASNKWIVLDNASDDTIKIGHAKAGADKPTSAGEDEDAAPLFGQSFKTPYFKYDETGHVINHALRTVTLPIGSLTDKDVTNSTSNVLTAIDFIPSTGAITVMHDNISDLLLTGLTSVKESDAAWVQNTDDIKGAFVKVDTRLDNEITRAATAESDLNKRIDDLDYTDTPGTGKVVYSVSQTDGAISTEHKNVGELLMDGYVKPTTLANQALSATESLNTGLGKLEYRLEAEVKAREDAIKALDVSDTAVENSYVTEVSETDGKISIKRTALPTLQTGASNGTIKLSNGNDVSVYGLKSAAYTDSTAYATAEQGVKADNALPATQTFAYGEEQKTIAELFALVHALSAEVNQLRTDLTALQEKVNTEHPVTVEPETPAEPTE